MSSKLTWVGWEFDVVRTETLGDSVRIAEHAREDGSLDADHIIEVPPTVSADVVWTDTPDGNAHEPGRSDALYRSLVDEMLAGTVADLETGVRTYPSMALVSVTRRRSRPEAAARISLAWAKVRKVASATVNVPDDSVNIPDARPTSPVGKVQTETPPSQAESRSASWILQLIGG